MSSLNVNPHDQQADSDSDASDENGTHEMALLENTIQKVGNLLQIGFGAAGSRIIAQNLQAGEFNPMVKGAKVHAIFGFCDIRQFTDATECLQEVSVGGESTTPRE